MVAEKFLEHKDKLMKKRMVVNRRFITPDYMFLNSPNQIKVNKGCFKRFIEPPMIG